MPSDYSLETLPEPNDARVKLRMVAPANFAVSRFPGFATMANVEAKTADLVAFAKAHHLHAIGARRGVTPPDELNQARSGHQAERTPGTIG